MAAIVAGTPVNLMDYLTMNKDHMYFSSDYKKRLTENGNYTRDIPYLNLYENHYVFVYGSLKRGHSRHSILTASQRTKFCGVGVSDDHTFDLVIADPGNIPVLLESTAKERLLKIKGELWLVDTETLIKLDHIESNGYLYERQSRRFWVGKESIPAWIYIGCPKFWRDKVLRDFPKFVSNNCIGIPMDQRTNKHFHYSFDETMARKLMRKNDE